MGMPLNPSLQQGKVARHPVHLGGSFRTYPEGRDGSRGYLGQAPILDEVARNAHVAGLTAYFQELLITSDLDDDLATPLFQPGPPQSSVPPPDLLCRPDGGVAGLGNQLSGAHP